MKYFNFNPINIFTNHTTGFFKHNQQVITQKAEKAVQNHLQKLPLELWRFFSSVQFSHSVVSYSLRIHGLQYTRPPVHHQLLEFTQTHVHWVGDAIQPSHSLSSPSPPAFNLSQHQGFSSESVLCIRWPKYWSFSFSISPCNDYSGLVSFRMDWLDLLAIQGTLKSLLQHHSSKASILPHSAFFIVQLSHPYVATGKTIASP